MLATIEKCETGTCVWCKARGEGVQAKFDFGLQGFFCKKDFWTALKVRFEAKEAGPVVEPPKAGRSS
ncbi:MAG: hypothetical protein NT069_10300 [Planctomycetota bacterium]|nr:hypothetical protein [Planctomycetota bacterium]